jgi:4-hydroxy-3-polyprenylbenzoate decarboxylase
MPLPEGLSELVFAGMLAGKRFSYSMHEGHILSEDADFVITGTITDQVKPEGPFGDHLGYYSLTHPFPVLKIDRVYARHDAIWPFTVVGRPPQEDTSFGELIHEITGPMVPVSLPGVKALHAVDQAGVHPLLLAIGTERYTPYSSDDRPAELLTQSHAILGFNQCSLAKYLFITDEQSLDINDIEGFFRHLFERVDFTNDLHFHTRTTMDTLDYSGDGLNQGSKLVIAARGQKRRTLTTALTSLTLPPGFHTPKFAMSGILVVSGPKHEALPSLDGFCRDLQAEGLGSVALIVVADDAEFTARNFDNFLWVTFTRSAPAKDCYGIQSFTEHKHFGCHGPLVIDARIKAHHAPALDDDPQVVRRAEELLGRGKSLHGIIV